MAYPDLEDLVSASGVPELTGASDADAEAMRLAAILAVEEFTGQSFESWEGTINVAAGKSGTLFLPRRLESITAIAGAGAIAVADVTIADTFDRLTLADWRWNSTAYERAMRKGFGEESVEWGDSVAITGVWGWDECPEQVVLAIRYDMEDTARADMNDLSATVAAYRKLGLRDASQGNLRINIGVPSVLSPRASRLLTGLVWSGAGGFLV
jgi:hypothetical protein